MHGIVYLVTDGCYSDYRVMGAYSTKEQAEDAKKRYGADNDIEEFILGEMPDIPNGYYSWRVEIKRNGDIKDVSNIYVSRDLPENSIYPTYTRPPEYIANIYCQAKTQEHAVKIANEKRAEMIASGEWDSKEKDVLFWGFATEGMGINILVTSSSDVAMESESQDK